MKLKSLNRNNSFSFALIAVVIIATAGLAFGVALPSINSWRLAQADKLIVQAHTASDPSAVRALLSQAALLGPDYPMALQELANNYWRAGEYDKAISTYQSGWVAVNNNFLGGLAIKASNAALAKQLYTKANKQEESAQSQSGLAIVNFIDGNNSQGCIHAQRATKLNLSSPQSEQAKAICAIFSGGSKLGAREQAYILANAGIYNIALEKLGQLATKSVGDWELMANIQAAQGQLGKATDSLKSALNQNPSSKTTLKLLINILNKSGQTGDIATYQTRLNSLGLTNF